MVREIEEEVGIDVAVEKILFATSFNTDPTRQVVILTYLCRPNHIKVALSEEHVDYKWATKEQLKALLTPDIFQDFERHQVFSWL